MNFKKLSALGGATFVLAAIPAGAALAAGGTAVTVRVEGLKKTLLAPTQVHPRAGWITRYGAPKGECSGTSAQGALDLATRHKWRGVWSTEFGPEYEITSILGETHSFTPPKYYWEIFTDNVAASAGACQLKLHPGEQLLFAAVPDSGTEYPLAIEAPRSATVGRTFDVEVVYFKGGARKPLAGATLSVGGRSGKTDGHGMVLLTPSHAGTFVLRAEHSGYVRAAPVTLHVS
jgi:hypothetical protein